MRLPLRYILNGTLVAKEVNYIPVPHIFAVLLTVLEVAAVIGILVVLCYYVPHFYVLAWLTEIGCMSTLPGGSLQVVYEPVLTDHSEKNFILK